MDNTNPRASRGKRNGIGKNFRENYESIDWGHEGRVHFCGGPWDGESVDLYAPGVKPIKLLVMPEDINREPSVEAVAEAVAGIGLKYQLSDTRNGEHWYVLMSDISIP